MRNGIIRSVLAFGLTLTGVSAQAQDPEAGEVAVESETTTTTTTVSTDGAGSSSSASTGSRGPLRVYGGFHIGGGGNWKFMPEEGDSEKTDMGFLGGLQAGVEYVIHPYVSLGGEFRFTRTRIDIDLPDFIDDEDVDNEISILDLVFKPKGRYEFSNIPLEVYGTLPVGVDLLIPSADDSDTKFNMNLGIGAGATYFFTERMGVNTEFTGIFHWFRETAETEVGDFTARNRLGQFYWFNNFVYVL